MTIQVQNVTKRFGTFEADPASGELRRAGRVVSLQDQPFRLLLLLTERPGELVTRDEIRRRLWGEIQVDFEEGLNTAVRKLRDALGDSASNPRFVETLPRRGYRFIASVEAVTTIGSFSDRLVEAAVFGLREPVGGDRDLVLRRRCGRGQCEGAGSQAAQEGSKRRGPGHGALVGRLACTPAACRDGSLQIRTAHLQVRRAPYGITWTSLTKRVVYARRQSVSGLSRPHSTMNFAVRSQRSSVMAPMPCLAASPPVTTPSSLSLATP